MDVKLIKTKTRRRRQAGGFILQANKHIILFVLLIVFMLGLFLGHTFVRNNFELNDAIKMSFSDYNNITGKRVRYWWPELVYLFSIWFKRFWFLYVDILSDTNCDLYCSASFR